MHACTRRIASCVVNTTFCRLKEKHHYYCCGYDAAFFIQPAPVFYREKLYLAVPRHVPPAPLHPMGPPGTALLRQKTDIAAPTYVSPLPSLSSFFVSLSVSLSLKEKNHQNYRPASLICPGTGAGFGSGFGKGCEGRGPQSYRNIDACPGRGMLNRQKKKKKGKVCSCPWTDSIDTKWALFDGGSRCYAWPVSEAGVFVCLSSPCVTHFCRLFMKRPLSLGLRAATTCDVIVVRDVTPTQARRATQG